MKKRIIGIITVLFIISGVITIVPETTKDVSAASAVKYVTTSKTYKIGKTKIFTYKGKRAVLQSKSKVAKKVNNYLRKIQNKKRAKMLAYAKEMYYKQKSFTPSSLNDTITLTYNKSGKYSFKEKDMGYWSNAAHTYTEIYGYTFLKKTGKKISILSTINNKKSFKKKICKAYSKKYNEKTYIWLNIENTPLTKYQYFLKGDYIYVTLNLGSVSLPYADVKVKI